MRPGLEVPASVEVHTAKQRLQFKVQGWLLLLN